MAAKLDLQVIAVQYFTVQILCVEVVISQNGIFLAQGVTAMKKIPELAHRMQSIAIDAILGKGLDFSSRGSSSKVCKNVVNRFRRCKLRAMAAIPDSPILPVVAPESRTDSVGDSDIYRP